MEPLLDVRDLSVSFPLSRGLIGMLDRTRPAKLNAVREIGFSLERGETLGLVGESGSGKTTVIRALNGLIPRDGGSVHFNGHALGGSDRAFHVARRNMAMLFQDPMSSLSPRLRVGSLIMEPFRVHKVQVNDQDEKLAELLEMVGLSRDIGEYYPHELSGGQARRVGIARALALSPRLILADEPTAGLDVSVQGQILNLMLRLQRELGISYIVVTHDLAVVRHIAHQLAIMYLGRIVEHGDTRSVFSAPKHPYTHLLLEAEPKPDPRKRRDDEPIKGEIPSLLQRPSGCGFRTRCPYARDRCRVEDPQPREVAANRTARCHFPLSEPEPPTTGALASQHEDPAATPGTRESRAGEDNSC